MYLRIIHYETVLRDPPVPLMPFIASSKLWTMVHLISVAITTLAVMLLPVYRALFQKINTSIEDDEAADILDDDEKLIWEDE
jgi:hypothetical protein